MWDESLIRDVLLGLVLTGVFVGFVIAGSVWFLISLF